MDYEAIPPGEVLRRTISRGIRRSRLLIVVASAAAMRSSWVALEVGEGRRHGRKVVVVNVGGAYVAGTWELDPDLVWVDETAQALPAGQPSPGIIEEILKRVAHTRRQTVVVRTLTASIFVLLALLAAAVWNWRRAVVERETALAQKLVALSNTEALAGPQTQERVALLLLESLRRRETPEVIGRLAAATRLLRPAVAEVKTGDRLFGMVPSPDRSLVAAIGMNANYTEGYIGVWESPSLQRRWTRPLPTKGIYIRDGMLAWSPDGRHLYWAGPYASVDVIDAATGATLRTLAPASWSPRVAASPDGRWIAAAPADDGTVTVWTAGDFTPVVTVNVTRNVLSLEFSPDARMLAFGGGPEAKTSGPDNEDFSLLAVMMTGAWTTPPRIIRVPHAVNAIAFGRSGRALVLLPAFDEGAHLYDAESLTRVRTFGGTLFINSAQFSAKNRYLLTVSRDRTARLWYPNGYQHAFFPHAGDIGHAAISPDERWLATAGNDFAARVWATTADNPMIGEAEKRRETLRLGHSGSVANVAFDRDGRHLLTASADGYLRRWSLAPDPLLQALPTEWLNKLAIAPNGASLVTAGGNYSPGLWTLEGDSAPRRLAPHQDDLSDASYSADGRWLATSDNKLTTIVFSTDAYTPMGRFTGRYSAVDRDALVTAGNGRTLQRFTLPSGERLEDIETSAEIQALAISSANQVAAVLDNGTVLLHDLTARSSIERARLAHERVRNVAYSPAGDRLATTGPDGTVRIWDATGQLLKTFSAADQLTAVAFDRSGSHVAAGGPTGEIAIWDVVSGEVVSRFAHPGKIATLGFAPAGPEVLSAATAASAARPGGRTTSAAPSARVCHAPC